MPVHKTTIALSSVIIKTTETFTYEQDVKEFLIEVKRDLIGYDSPVFEAETFEVVEEMKVSLQSVAVPVKGDGPFIVYGANDVIIDNLITNVKHYFRIFAIKLK